jgi:hypothetical protein
MDNHLKINRAKKTFIFQDYMYLLWGFAILLYSTLSGCLNANATYFAAGISNYFVVVSIDSRATQPLRAPDDQFCKILPLADNTIFFATGLVSKDIDGGDRKWFDVRTAAREAFAAKTTEGIKKLVDDWASRMTENYRTYLDQGDIILSHPNVSIVDGFFARTYANHIEVYKSTINKPVFGVYTYTTERLVPSDDTVPIYNNGHPEILNEFGAPITERAAEVQRKIQTQAADKPRPEAMAIATYEIVRFVRDNAGDPMIGGETATIMMEHGQHWRWYRHPKFCPEQ